MDSPDTLQQAIDEARSGNRMGASRLLAQYVTQNPQSDVAWLWLAACLEEREQQLYCLKKASAINPSNPDTISSLNELINPPWAWRGAAEAIELPAGNAEIDEFETAFAASAPEAERQVFVFPEPEPFSFKTVEEEPAEEQLEPVAVEVEPQPKKTGSSRSQVTILIVLVIAIIVVLAVLGYMVITASPDSLPPFLRNLLYGGGIILGPGF